MALWRKTRQPEAQPPVLTPAFAPTDPPVAGPPARHEFAPVGPTTDVIDPRVELADNPADTVQEPAHQGRGGRNLGLAAAVGIVMLVGVIASVWFHTLAFAVVLYGASLGAVIEWRRALSSQGRQLPLVPLVAATVGMAVAAWNGLAEGLGVALLVGCIGTVAWRVADERIDTTMGDSVAAIMTLLWIPFLASFFMLMALAEGGWMRVVVVILAIVGNDTGALFAGMTWGKRKLAPRVSPKKTWEGAAGGVLLGTISASVASYFFFDGRWWLGALVGAAATIAAVIGDLAESLLKRDLQVKDMSGAIPGHGGILDRMDSALFAAPVAYLVFAIVLGTT